MQTLCTTRCRRISRQTLVGYIHACNRQAIPVTFASFQASSLSLRLVAASAPHTSFRSHVRGADKSLLWYPVIAKTCTALLPWHSRSKNQISVTKRCTLSNLSRHRSYSKTIPRTPRIGYTQLPLQLSTEHHVNASRIRRATTLLAARGLLGWLLLLLGG